MTDSETAAQDELIEELKKLRDKANMQATMHAILCDRYGQWNMWLTTAILVFSTLLTGLTFISESFVQSSIGISPEQLKWLTGIASIVTFCGVLLQSQWNWQGKAAHHREATRFYFRITNQIRSWLDCGRTITIDMIEEIRSEYAKTDALPKIPNGHFLRLKQQHLQRVAISRELDRMPFDSIRSIRDRLGKRKDNSD